MDNFPTSSQPDSSPELPVSPPMGDAGQEPASPLPTPLESSEVPLLPEDAGQTEDFTPSGASGSHIPRLVAIIATMALLLLGGIFFISNYFQTRLDTQNQAPEPTVARIIQSGQMIVGTDPTFPPMEFLDENGEFKGYDIDMANRIAEKLGVKAEFRVLLWDDIFDALEQKQIDVVISSMSITEERKQRFDFSEPYINAGQVIITRKEDNTIKSTADLFGKTIAVQTGTTNETEALKYTNEENVASYEDFILAADALVNGQVDAIFSDLTGAKGIISTRPSLKIASEPFTTETYGIMFRKGEEDLVRKVNEVLNSLRQQGVLVYLKQKWLE